MVIIYTQNNELKEKCKSVVINKGDFNSPSYYENGIFLLDKSLLDALFITFFEPKSESDFALFDSLKYDQKVNYLKEVVKDKYPLSPCFIVESDNPVYFEP